VPDWARGNTVARAPRRHSALSTPLHPRELAWVECGRVRVLRDAAPAGLWLVARGACNEALAAGSHLRLLLPRLLSVIHPIDTGGSFACAFAVVLDVIVCSDPTVYDPDVLSAISAPVTSWRQDRNVQTLNCSDPLPTDTAREPTRIHLVLHASNQCFFRPFSHTQLC
jgi:hypothetical protein